MILKVEKKQTQKGCDHKINFFFFICIGRHHLTN